MNLRLFKRLEERSFDQLVKNHGIKEVARVIEEDEAAKPGLIAGMRVFKPLLVKKLQELVNPIVFSVVQGELPQTEMLISQNPELVSMKGTATDYLRRTISNVTPFQAALCAWNDEMCKMLAKYMTPDDIAKQYEEIFPEGSQAYLESRRPFDFSTLIDVISQSSAKDIQNALNMKQDESLLCQTLKQFRSDFSTLSCQERIFNPQHHIKVYELNIEQFNLDRWSFEQQELLWCQVTGYVQRFLPYNIVEDVTKRLHYLVGQKEVPKRPFDFLFRLRSSHPLRFDDSSGLGFHTGYWGSSDLWQARVRHVFHVVCQEKTRNLQVLYNDARRRQQKKL